MDLSELRSFLKPQQITQDPDQLQKYGKDWTKHFVPSASAIIFPSSTEDVQRLVLWARKHRVGLVPSGGRTGLSGGATALNGEAVVSFEKMNRILSFDPFDPSVRCEAGVVTESLQNFAKEKGLFYPVDFASRGSSQVGGNVATNAGGIKVVRYGLTRGWVAGLKVVTGAGEVLELNRGLVKNATGYDLRQLFIGSEGTLGFVTEAEILLTRPPGELRVMVLGVPELSAVMKLFELFKMRLPLTAYEMFTDRALHYIMKAGHGERPFETKTPYYVLIEFEESLDLAMECFEYGLEQGWAVDGVVSQNSKQARDLWKLREDITESTEPFEPYKNDVSVRVSKTPDFLQEVDAMLKKEYPDMEVVWFGHIGDGNLHINILKPSSMKSAEFVENCKKVDKLLFSKIQEFEGSISAEHGVGLTKKPFLSFTRSKEEISIMRSIKKVLDPDGIMNPGKMFTA